MKTDRFGLPVGRKESESDKERANRLASVNEFARKAFAATIDHLGVEEAQKLWRDILNANKRKPGRRPKSEPSDWDLGILFLYDEIEKDPHSKILVRHLSQSLFNGINKNPLIPNDRKFASQQALERKIRRVIKERDAGKWIRDKSGNYILNPRWGGH